MSVTPTFLSLTSTYRAMYLKPSHSLLYLALECSCGNTNSILSIV